MTRTYQPGDRVHFDGDRTGTPTPRDDEDYEPPAWATVVTREDVPGVYRMGNNGDRTPVRWDDESIVDDPSNDTTFALTSCLVPASEAPEPDPRES